MADLISHKSSVPHVKRNSDKTTHHGPYDRNVISILPTERSVDGTLNVSPRFHSMPLQVCLDSSNVFDPNVNYAHVLASLLIYLETHDEWSSRSNIRSK